jgi:hypothetical protein
MIRKFEGFPCGHSAIQLSISAFPGQPRTSATSSGMSLSIILFLLFFFYFLLSHFGVGVKTQQIKQASSQRSWR